MKRLVPILLLSVVGCSSITYEHVQKVEKGIALERRAVVPREGFEEVLPKHRAALDEAIAAMKSATK